MKERAFYENGRFCKKDDSESALVKNIVTPTRINEKIRLLLK